MYSDQRTVYSAVIFVMDAENEYEIKRVREAIQTIETIQSMIDVSADRLEGLRTQCSTSAELTQQEIRTLEVGELTFTTRYTPRGNEQCPCRASRTLLHSRTGVNSSLPQWKSLPYARAAPSHLECLPFLISRDKTLQQSFYWYLNSDATV